MHRHAMSSVAAQQVHELPLIWLERHDERRGLVESALELGSDGSVHRVVLVDCRVLVRLARERS